MRLHFHFSVRLLLVLTALAAAACYWWVARPTLVAYRFSSSLNRGDYTEANTWCYDKTQPSFTEIIENGNHDREWYWKATVRSRTWLEIWYGCRTINLEIRGRPAEDEPFEILVPYPAAIASSLGIDHNIRLPTVAIELNEKSKRRKDHY